MRLSNGGRAFLLVPELVVEFLYRVGLDPGQGQLSELRPDVKADRVRIDLIGRLGDGRLFRRKPFVEKRIEGVSRIFERLARVAPAQEFAQAALGLALVLSGVGLGVDEALS